MTATRNRPGSLLALLSSISNLELKPQEVIVVSSGISIGEVLDQFTNLPIRHIHTEAAGQIHQKTLGIKEIGESIEWVLFLDDDLIVYPNSVTELFKAIHDLDCNDLIGVGLSMNTSKDVNISFFEKYFRKPGTVTRAGTNVNYMVLEKITKTRWLNGASMWKRKVLTYYHFPVQHSRFAMCEDLIFSYRCGKVGDLLFIPNASFSFQNTATCATPPDEDVFSRFIASHLWQIYFIRENTELSLGLYFWISVFRFIKLVTSLIMKKITTQKYWWRSVKIYVKSFKYLVSEIGLEDDLKFTQQ